MRLFLDSSVLLSAAGSARGASRFVVTEAAAHEWELVSADYCAEEARRNLQKLGPSAAPAWRKTVESAVTFVGVRLALDKPLVFPKAKDRPVVITALAARCEWLLTLDETDFHGNLGREVYGMCVATPGEFLIAQRQAGLI